MLYDEFVERNRPGQWKICDETGGLHGPFNVLLDTPPVSRALLAVNAAVRESGLLSHKEVEVIILMVASRLDSAFEWYAHARLARDAGVADSMIADLGADRFQPVDERLAAIQILVEQLLSRDSLVDALYAQIEGVLGRPCIVAIAVLVGNYETVASMLRLFDVGVPDE